MFNIGLCTWELSGDIDSDKSVLERVNFAIEILHNQVVEFNQLLAIIKDSLLCVIKHVITELVPQPN
jgi:hypothetical protein